MMRIGVIALFVLAACGGAEIKQHGGYKSPKARPWEKPKVLKLEKNAAKADADLDYQRYKRARWYLVETPGPGSLDVQMEVTPGGPGGGEDEESEEQDMDVALEILDGKTFNVLAKSDLEAEDAHELKKQRTLKDLPEGPYLIHVYLQGRVDTADVDLKVTFARGELPWKSDFPNQVAFVDDLAAVPPLDDSPEPVVVKKKKVTRVKTTTTTTTSKPDPRPTGFSVQAEISDVQPSGSGSIITIAGGTSDGLANGYAGSIKGVRGSSFKLTGCGASTCRATVKAAPEDVRGASGVLIKVPATAAVPE